jgi:cytoskeletal protein RodZ
MRPKIRWIVALVGMLVVPLGGLVWAAVGSGPAGETTDGETSASAETDEEAGSTASGATKKKKKKKKSKSTKAPKSGPKTTGRKPLHDDTACCEALRAAWAEDDDIAKRPTFLAAASACEAAPTKARARAQVKSIVEGSKMDLPSACTD